MKMKICFMAIVLGLVASTATYGANMHFNFGGVDTANLAYDATSTPGQAAGAVPTGATYNNVITSNGTYPLRFEDGTLDLGLTMTIQTLGGNNSDNAYTWNPISHFSIDAGPNPVGIQNGPGGTNGWMWQSEVGMFINGLSAGTYDIYVSSVAHGDSTAEPPVWSQWDSMPPSSYHIVAGVDNTIDDLSFGDLTLQSATITNQTFDSWVEGDNYAKLRVTLAAGDRLGIGTDNQTVGMCGLMNTVEIVEVPEPATMALMGLGSLVMLRRRK
jgi:hypothetical protein